MRSVSCIYIASSRAIRRHYLLRVVIMSNFSYSVSVANGAREMDDKVEIGEKEEEESSREHTCDC